MRPMSNASFIAAAVVMGLAFWAMILVSTLLPYLCSTPR